MAELNVFQEKIDALRRLQVDTAAELDALLPAILDRAFLRLGARPRCDQGPMSKMTKVR